MTWLLWRLFPIRMARRRIMKAIKARAKVEGVHWRVIAARALIPADRLPPSWRRP